MEIRYNNETLPSNLITFSDIPNILKVEDESGGTYATISFSFNATLYNSLVLEDGKWYITIMGETITNVTDPKLAINKAFYIAQTNESTIASIARALRNCPTIAANFNVDFSGGTITLTAKAIGSLVSNDSFSTNISQCVPTITDGMAFSDLYGSKIDVSIYSDGEYITTLQKNFYDGEAAFNITPIINTLAKTGATVPYTMKVSSLSADGTYSVLGNIGENHASIGYMVNQGEKFLDNTYMNFAQNWSRGKQRNVENNSILYLYQPSISLSFYRGNEGGGNYTINYLDSAYNVVYSEERTWENHYSSIKLINLEIPLVSNIMSGIYYVDLVFGIVSTIRYNVIKPLYMTEYNQRIKWINSYGGVSFFDFTGQKTETRDLETKTYQKNIFDYYTDPINELEKIYDNEVKYTVTLKSHLLEKDGTYIFNDLLQSPYVWTEINGENYAIIIDSISVDETDNNDIYQATVRYRYSQQPSLI